MDTTREARNEAEAREEAEAEARAWKRDAARAREATREARKEMSVEAKPSGDGYQIDRLPLPGEQIVTRQDDEPGWYYTGISGHGGR